MIKVDSLPSLQKETEIQRDSALEKAIFAYQDRLEKENLSLSFDVKLPLAESILSELESNLRAMADLTADLLQLHGELDRAKARAEWIGECGHELAMRIRLAGELSKENKYREALAALNVPEIPEELQIYRFYPTFLETSQWLKAHLYHELAEFNIMHDALPLEDEEYADYVALAASLPLGMYDYPHQWKYKDHARGLSFSIAAYKLKAKPLLAKELDSYISLLRDFLYHNHYGSDLTKWRFRAFRYTFLCQFNASCHYYFDVGRDYKKALAFFQSKAIFKPGDLDHPAYVHCEDELSFRIAFLKNDMLRKSDVDFREEIASVALMIAARNDIASTSLAEVRLALEDPKKIEIYDHEMLSLRFEQKIYLFDAMMALSPDLALQKEMLAILLDRKSKRKVHLEDAAPALLSIREKLEPSLLGKYESLVGSLFHSLTATRICTKTTVEEVRELAHRPNKMPRGKKTRATTVVGHSTFGYVMSWIFTCLVAIGAIGGVAFFVYLYCPADIQPFAYLAPLFGLYFFFAIIVIAHSGTDEAPSAYFRRIMGVVTLLLALGSLAYFGWPTQLAFLSSVGYTMIIGSASMMLLSMWIFREFRPRIRYFTYWPAFAVLVAALVMMIINMMNGLI